MERIGYFTIDSKAKSGNLCSIGVAMRDSWAKKQVNKKNRIRTQWIQACNQSFFESLELCCPISISTYQPKHNMSNQDSEPDMNYFGVFHRPHYDCFCIYHKSIPGWHLLAKHFRIGPSPSTGVIWSWNLAIAISIIVFSLIINIGYRAAMITASSAIPSQFSLFKLTELSWLRVLKAMH